MLASPLAAPQLVLEHEVVEALLWMDPLNLDSGGKLDHRDVVIHLWELPARVEEDDLVYRLAAFNHHEEHGGGVLAARERHYVQSAS